MASTPVEAISIPSRASESIRCDSFATMPDLRFQQLQNEIAILKEELKTSEHDYHSKRAILEQEVAGNEIKYKNKIALFQNKFTALSEETRVSETNYKNEVAMVKEQLAATEQTWHSRLDRLEQSLVLQKDSRDQEIATLVQHIQNQADELKVARADTEMVKQSMTKEYLMLHMRFEVVQRTSEKRAKEAEEAKADFDRARFELNETLNKRHAAFRGLQKKMEEHAADILAVRDDGSADKEELEAMIQSWMGQHDILNNQVQELAQELKAAKEDILLATDERDDTIKSVQKMGQTWENLFENVLEQVQEQADEHKSFTALQGASNKAMEEKVNTHNTMFDDKLLDIELRLDEQKKLISQNHHEKEVNAREIIALHQIMGASDEQTSNLERRVTEQAKAQSSAQVEFDGLNTVVEKLAEANSSRLYRLETDTEREFKELAGMKETLLSTLDDNTNRVKAVDNKIVIHSIQLGEMAQEIKQQGYEQTAMKCVNEKTQRDTTQILESRKAEFDALESQLLKEVGDQKGVNNDLYKLLVDCTTATAEVDKKSAQLANNLADLAKRMDEQADEHNATRGDFEEGHISLGERIEERIVDVAKLMLQAKTQSKAELEAVKDEFKTTLQEHNASLTLHDAKLTTFGPQIQQLIQESKGHADDQNVAKEARAVIRSDLKQLMAVMYEEDEKLRGQIENQGEVLKSKLAELLGAFAEHEQEHQKMEIRVAKTDAATTDRQETALREMSSKMDVAQSHFEKLKTEVEEQTEAQLLANEAREAITTDLAKLSEAVEGHSENLSLKIEEHFADLKSKQRDLSVVLDKNEEEQRQLEAKLEKYNAEVREQQEVALRDIGAKMSATQSSLDDLQLKVGKQGDALKTAKDARVVIRNDLKQLINTMHSQDGKLGRQIEETAAYLKQKRIVFKTLLAKHEAEHSALEAKVEQYNAASKEHHVTVVQDVDAKLGLAKSNADELKCKAEKQIDDQSLAIGQFALQSDLEKLAEASRQQHEKLACQTDELVANLRAQHNELKVNCDKHEVEQQELESKLEKYSAAAKEEQTTLLRDIVAKVDGSLLHADKLTSEVEQLSKTQAAIQSALQKERVEQHADMLKAATTEIQTNKAEIEQKMESISTALHDNVNDRIQCMEQKLDGWTSQFNDLVRQVETHTDETKATKQQVETFQNEMERLTETQMSQFEHLLYEVNQQADELEAAKASMPSIVGDVGDGLAQQTKYLVTKFETLLRKKEAASKTIVDTEASTKACMESLLGEIQQQLSLLKTTADEVKALRNDDVVDFQETSVKVDAQGTSVEKRTQEIMERTTAALTAKFESVLQQVQQQAADLQSAKDIREAMQEKSNDLAEQLHLQIQALVSKTEQQAADLNSVQEERDRVQKELEAAQMKNKGLTVTVVGMKEQQKKYKTDVRKRKGQLKEMMAVSSEIKREVCFSIEEESREATEESSNYSTSEDRDNE